MVEPTDWLGVDVGWVYPAADSDGDIYRWSKPAERAHINVTIAGPCKITKADGTTITRDAYDAGQLADVYARGNRNNDRLRVNQLAKRVVGKARRTNRGIALESWETLKQRRSAWIDVHKAITYEASQRGVAVRMVNRAWTSLTCPECGFIDRENRPDRGSFRCTHCGHAGQADIIAAHNIRQRAVDHQQVERDQPGLCANPACRSPEIFQAGRCCRCYFWAYRKGKYPTAEELELIEVAANYREFVALNSLGTTRPKKG